MSTDIRHVNVSANVTAVGTACRIRGFTVTTKADAPGQIVIRDGGASGTVVLRRDVVSGNSMNNEHVEAMGIRCQTNMHVTVPTSVIIGIYYD